MDDEDVSALLLLAKKGAIYWTVRRKAAVVAAIGAGDITQREARKNFQLSAEELNGWITAIAKDGVPGLRSTRFQIYNCRGRWRREAAKAI